MEQDKGTKLLLETLVKEYTEANAQEIIDFREYMKGVQDGLKNDFAEFKGANYVERAISEFPEGLDAYLIAKMPKDDYEWFRSKEGMRWFVKKFPLFAVPNAI